MDTDLNGVVDGNVADLSGIASVQERTAVRGTNAAPSGSDLTLTTAADTDRTFTGDDFPFTDSDGDLLKEIRIVALPVSAAGELELSGTAIPSAALPQTVSVFDLRAGKLVFDPEADFSGAASFTFQVVDTFGAASSVNTAGITVRDPIEVVADAKAPEGGTLEFDVSLDIAADASVSVDYATADGTATTGEDYEPASGTLTFEAGERTKTVAAAVLEDGLAEDDETLTLALSNASRTRVAVAEATGTIRNGNAPATGAPTIAGTARVGETLTASTAGIEDADGPSGATFAHQWLSNGGDGDTEIAGANGRSYTPSDANAGRRVKVRVTFTDDAGHEEALTSAATEPVAVASRRPLRVRAKITS